MPLNSVPVVAIPQDTIIEKDTVGEVVSPPTVKEEPVVVRNPKRSEVVKKKINRLLNRHLSIPIL